MNIVILPIIILGCWLTYSIIAGLWHVWMVHRLKLSLLHDYQRDPDSFPSWEVFQEDMHQKLDQMGERTLPEFRLIGMLIIALGTAATATGLFLQIGTWAVALYTGGFAAIILGVLLTGFGMMLHAAKSTPAQHPSQHQ
ncbi:MAG: hypothetical protein COA73_13200 [Candidatus Hydrogenedentota bacterium]|nr:MAG: hypothetical protein COA73_13200 [Candidatus Hydrogenedentota bacterium]